MSVPLPFQVAREIGNNLSGAFNKQKDQNSIEQILAESMQSQDPAVLQQSIGKILSQVSPERQGAAVQYLQSAFNNVKSQQEKTRKETMEKEAATQGGYTYGAPPAVQAQQIRNQQPPKPAGGLTGQAVPNEVGAAIGKIIQENPTATADELAIAFDAASIPPIYSNKYVENRRRQDETKAKNEVDEKKITREEELAFHKEGEKYDQDLFHQAKVAKGNVETLKNIDKAIKSGNIKPGSWANIFKGFGKIGDKISEALINEDEATLLTSIPQLLEGWKDVFGVRLTDADLRLLQDKLPSIGKTQSANNAVIKILKKYADMTLLRSSIAAQLKAANKGLRPLGYADKIEQRFDEMVAPVKIINPTNGREIEIPAYQLSDAIKSGARLANQAQEQPNEL